MEGGNTGRLFRIRVTDADDDEYMTCSTAIEVASTEEVEEEGDVPCVGENVPTSDDEDGRNDDGVGCEWASSLSDDDGVMGVIDWQVNCRSRDKCVALRKIKPHNLSTFCA